MKKMLRGTLLRGGAISLGVKGSNDEGKAEKKNTVAQLTGIRSEAKQPHLTHDLLEGGGGERAHVGGGFYPKI